MDAHDWPTHLGNSGLVGLVEESWDSSQFDYEAGLPTEGQRSLAFCCKWQFDSPAAAAATAAAAVMTVIVVVLFHLISFIQLILQNNILP